MWTIGIYILNLSGKKNFSPFFLGEGKVEIGPHNKAHYVYFKLVNQYAFQGYRTWGMKNYKTFKLNYIQRPWECI